MSHVPRLHHHGPHGIVGHGEHGPSVVGVLEDGLYNGRVSHMSRLHHHGPLGIVGLGEHGPSAVGVGVLEDGL